MSALSKIADLLPTPINYAAVPLVSITKRSRLLVRLLVVFVTSSFRLAVWWVTDKLPDLLKRAIEPISYGPYLGGIFRALSIILTVFRFVAMKIAMVVRRWVSVTTTTLKWLLRGFTALM